MFSNSSKNNLSLRLKSRKFWDIAQILSRTRYLFEERATHKGRRCGDDQSDEWRYDRTRHSRTRNHEEGDREGEGDERRRYRNERFGGLYFWYYRLSQHSLSFPVTTTYFPSSQSPNLTRLAPSLSVVAHLPFPLSSLIRASLSGSLFSGSGQFISAGTFGQRLRREEFRQTRLAL